MSQDLEELRLRALAMQKRMQAVLTAGRTTLDETTGAPMAVRMAVGSTTKPADRLATLQRYYPDAEAVDEDNFVFTDPESKRPTVYNPSGLDVGDVASVAPEVAEVLGGVAGGALATSAAVAGIPMTGGAALAAVPMAYGLGAAVGREGQNLLMKHIGPTVDTRSGVERLTDAATTAGANAVGYRAGELLEQGVKRVVAPATAALGRALAPAGRSNALALANAGVPARAGAVTGSKAVQLAEQALAATPGGVGPIRDRAREETAAIAREASDVASSYGPQQSRTDVGATIREGAKSAGGRFKDRQKALYEQAYSVIKGDSPVGEADVSALAAYRDQLARQVAESPNARGQTLSPTLSYVDGLLTDVKAGQLTFETLRKIRTDLGARLEDPVIAGMSSDVRNGLRPVYRMVTDAINEIASRAPKGRELIARADRYTRFNMNRNMETLQKIVDMKFDEQVFDFAMRGADKGGSLLYRLRRNLEHDEWDTLAGTVLGRMGLATPANRGATEMAELGGEFSVNTFLKNWNALDPKAREALFGGTRYKSLIPRLNNLVKVVEISKDADSLANTSGTARVLMTALGGLGVGGAGVGMMYGADMKDAAAGVAGAVAGFVVAPRVAARLITSPRFVAWLSQAVRAPDAKGLAAYAVRLATIAKVEPEIREEIQQFRAALRPAEIRQ